MRHERELFSFPLFLFFCFFVRFSFFLKAKQQIDSKRIAFVRRISNRVEMLHLHRNYNDASRVANEKGGLSKMTNQRPPPSIPQQKTMAQLEAFLRRREQRRNVLCKRNWSAGTTLAGDVTVLDQCSLKRRNAHIDNSPRERPL